MKRFAGIGVALAVVSTLAGLSFSEISEYVTVAGDRVGDAVRGAVPLSVEIDRMEVLLKKMDKQVSSQKYAVARANVALQEVEADLVRQESRCEALVAGMRQLRALTSNRDASIVQVGCHQISSADVSQALAHKLATWKESNTGLAARQEAVSQQRKAFEALRQRYSDWQQQRKLLAYRLETLRSRHDAQQLAAETDTSVFKTADLARASELADRIERELKTVEIQQQLDNDPLENLLHGQPTTDPDAMEAEVDAILDSSAVKR